MNLEFYLITFALFIVFIRVNSWFREYDPVWKNKANLRQGKIGVKSYMKGDYEDIHDLWAVKNKANLPAFGRKPEILSSKS